MENEIKVNEFVRTKDGVIDKVIIDYKGKCNNPNCNRKHISCEKNYYNEDEIVKHSPNLIDLIQVGDMVHTRDVLNEDWYWMFDGEMVKATQETIEEGIDLVEIVTKEMMRSISYKVERNN